MTAPADPFAPAAAAGIHRLAIPTPFAVGRVNVYMIEDDPLTLVDTGPYRSVSSSRTAATSSGPAAAAIFVYASSRSRSCGT